MSGGRGEAREVEVSEESSVIGAQVEASGVGVGEVEVVARHAREGEG